MDRVFGSRFGSQQPGELLQLEAQLECILMNDHLVNYLGNEAMRLLVILEIVRQRFGLADYCLYRAGRVFTDRQCSHDLGWAVQEPLQEIDHRPLYFFRRIARTLYPDTPCGQKTQMV